MDVAQTDVAPALGPSGLTSGGNGSDTGLAPGGPREVGPGDVTTSDPKSREAHLAHGERLGVPERVILAPIAGSFRPLADEVDDDGDIDEEQVIGFVEGQGRSAPVRSPFGGLLMGLLAHAGERVREGQPVAWIRVA
ncbi:MAG: hypothetical protein ACR2HV_03880 [Acidimicrobiales bacterium]